MKVCWTEATDESVLIVAGGMDSSKPHQSANASSVEAQPTTEAKRATHRRTR